jgi:hypothetical protein
MVSWLHSFFSFIGSLDPDAKGMCACRMQHRAIVLEKFEADQSSLKQSSAKNFL